MSRWGQRWGPGVGAETWVVAVVPVQGVRR